MSFAKKFIGAVLRVERTTDEIEAQRLAICGKCRQLKGDKCAVCGCYVELKAPMDKNKNPKAFMRIEKTHCPLGKWPYIDEEGNRHETDKEVANYYRNIDGKELLK